MQEVFRTIPGFSRYEVSQLGRVRSNTRKKPRILNGYSDNGYFRVHIMNDDGKNKLLTVHQAVAMAFLGFERPGTTRGLVVDHIDNDSSNNCVTNLRVISSRENTARIFNRELPHNVYDISKPGKPELYAVRIGNVKGGYQNSKSRITLGQYPTVQEAVEARDNYLQSIGEPYKSL